MGSVVQLKKTINNSYSDLLKSVEDKLILVNDKISSKLTSKVDLIQNMTDYHLDTGGKKLRALLTLSSSKLCGYSKGGPNNVPGSPIKVLPYEKFTAYCKIFDLKYIFS